MYCITVLFKFIGSHRTSLSLNEAVRESAGATQCGLQASWSGVSSISRVNTFRNGTAIIIEVAGAALLDAARLCSAGRPATRGVL